MTYQTRSHGLSGGSSIRSLAGYLAALVTPAVLLAGTGCRGSDRGADTTAAVTTVPDTAILVNGVVQPVDTIATVRAHLERLASADGDSLQALARADSQVVAMLISHCEAMMRSMNMVPPAAWTGTVTALKEDAARMRSMPPAQLTSFVPAHRKRVEALLDIHRTMPGM